MKVIDFQKANCKNCYRCVRSCGVKAIRIKNEQAQIMDDHCILCGHCLEVCPQNAKTFVSDLERVKDFIRRGEKVVVSVAPSYLGILRYEEPGQVADALAKLGFYQIRETAEGAAYVTKTYAGLLAEGKMENIITTCCPSVNNLIEKYYPSLIPFMAPVVSPMIAHGMLIKQELGDDVKVVFLGPCIAKKEEAEMDERTKGYIDGVINFEEVLEWLDEENIRITDCQSREMDNPDPQINRLYAVSNGVIQSVISEESANSYHKMFVDGDENCMELFQTMEVGTLHHCFIEANICQGGCIKGPAIDKMNRSRFKAKVVMEKRAVHQAPAKEEYNKELDIKKVFSHKMLHDSMPTEEEIRKILKSTGKYTKEDELNCGACGYSTCREKAIAVYQKKAEIDMCLPYALQKAQSMSNIVLDTTPNLILLVDSEMKIKEFNKKAQELFKISRDDALEHYVFEFMEDEIFHAILENHQTILRKKVVHEKLGLTMLAIMVYIEEMDLVLAIFQDITSEENKKLKQYQLKMETVEIAQKVIDKQMMVAQEIAGLLGETTAETKVTLTKLRDSILFDGTEGE